MFMTGVLAPAVYLIVSRIDLVVDLDAFQGLDGNARFAVVVRTETELCTAD